MSSVMDGAPRLEFDSAPAWRAWLELHHRQTTGVWLVGYKQGTGKVTLPYEEAICEALCFGWVDSTYRPLDEERGMLWYAPRRKGSLWSSSNKARVARLESEGRMHEAGRAAIERAKRDGTWDFLEPIEALEVPEDLQAALDRSIEGVSSWEGLSATAQRAYLLWIATARRPETRERRVAESVGLIVQGLRLEQR